MQTILGAGGAIGKDLAKELAAYTNQIRLVSRKPEKVNLTDQLHASDLTNESAVNEAVKGSEITYVTVGFEYNKKVWEKTWPPFMRHVIKACKEHNSKLVFFDNVYMYDPDYIHHMTEETPVRPVSRKGKVRGEIAKMIMEEVEKGNLNALIARSADFYGLKNSLLTEMVIKNLKKGKKAQWLADAGKVHNFTFVPDAAKGTAMLGNTEDAYDQVWHLPTDYTQLTMRDWVEMIASELGTKARLSVLPKSMMGLVGIFIPILKEVKEMAYQYDRDYFFDSSKFEKKFSYKPIAPKDGIRMIIDQLGYPPSDR